MSRGILGSINDVRIYTHWNMESGIRNKEWVVFFAALAAAAASAAILIFPATLKAQACSPNCIIVRPPNNLGLVGYWPFNEGTGTKAGDFSGNGNHGTLTNGPTWVNGKRSKALSFSQSSTHYVPVGSGSSLNVSGQMTVCAWVKPATIDNANFRSIVTKSDTGFHSQFGLGAEGSGSATGRQLSFGWSDNNAAFEVYLTDNDVLTIGTWTHICAVRTSGGVGLIYTDGQSRSVTSIVGDESPATVSAGTAIGRYGDADTAYWDGIVDDVRIYSRALSSTEVARLYSTSGAARVGASSADLDAGTALESGLTGHWTFDGTGVATRIDDRSGNSRHSYFVNTATSSAIMIGKLGQGSVLDGTNDYVRTGGIVSNYMSSSDGAMALWMYPTGTADNGANIYNGAGALGDSAGFMGIYRTNYTTPDPDQDRIWVFNWDSEVDGFGTTYNVNEWVHIAWVHTGGVLYLYKNGELVGTDPSGNTGGVAGTLRLGWAYDTTTDVFFEGRLDDARVYNRALTAAEIKQLYNLGRAKIQQ